MENFLWFYKTWLLQGHFQFAKVHQPHSFSCARRRESCLLGSWSLLAPACSLALSERQSLHRTNILPSDYSVIRFLCKNSLQFKFRQVSNSWHANNFCMLRCSSDRATKPAQPLRKVQNHHLVVMEKGCLLALESPQSMLLGVTSADHHTAT